MICESCGTENTILGNVFVFMPGFTDGIQNTALIARMCSACVTKLIQHEITCEQPAEAYTFAQIITDLVDI